MCGIVFKHNYDKKKPVNNDILQQFDAQRRRGTKGFGIFDGQYMNIVRETREDNILKWLVKKNSNLILFHHRLPTSTVNVARAAHPFSTKGYFGKTEYIFVHNGMIRNANDLWAAHQQLGIRYTSLLDDLSFNDSEALMWDVALTLEGKQDRMMAYGDMAFVMMKKVDGKLVNMLYGRNVRPLNIKKTDESIELSSEGAGISILSGMLYNFDFKTHTIVKAEMEFPQYRRFPAGSKVVNGKVQTYPPQQQSLLTAGGTTSSEYTSYDDWHNDKYGVQGSNAGTSTVAPEVESNWQRIRRKYGERTERELNEGIAEVLESERLDSASTQSIKQILEAKRDASGKFVVAEVKHGDVEINLDNIDLRDYQPTSSEIQSCAMDYMIEAQGNFEDAYSLLEHNYADYMESTNGVSTFNTIRQTLLFEAAMEFINSDDEYVNENSVSSIWQALWHQSRTALAGI